MSSTSTHKKLTELQATAICGNDISSSCLYVSALTIGIAGFYAPLIFLAVVLVLFVYRKIYGEVVGALPLNGGAYNALLNSSSKFSASLAAGLTILSYMATAVISAHEAMEYLHHIFHSINTLYAAIILLGIFMMLTIAGISESAVVAVAIFIFHLTTLTLLVVTGLIYVLNHGLDTIIANIQAGPPHVDWPMSKILVLGFASAMLGISGFESSANFVEEQASGVFPKTLRNMWVVVSIFNPMIALLALSLLDVGAITDPDNSTALLSTMGQKSAGSWLAWIISIDAVLVLSGAVLTSYVGVSGLMQRMALDRILPQYFLKQNNRGSAFRIIIAFFFLCLSILLVTDGEVTILAGVYSISFLSVMMLFSFGNILLKTKRARLPRPVRATFLGLTLSIVAVAIAIYGNINMPNKLGELVNFPTFIAYFVPTLIVLLIMLNRVTIIRAILHAISYMSNRFRKMVLLTNMRLHKIENKINSQEFVFFTKGDKIDVLRKVMQYVENNEETRKLKVVHVLQEGENVKKDFLVDLDVLDRAYPEIKIEFESIRNRVFSPELITELSEEWDIPKNFMFISSPSEKFPYSITDLGGVRLII